MTAAAAALFARRAYDGVGVDDLVQHLGVHRNSLYKTFGSKRGLYLAALRWNVSHVLRPLIDQLRGGGDVQRFFDQVTREDGLDLLLLAAVERAPADSEVAAVVSDAMQLLEQALAGVPAAPSGRTLSELLGERVRVRVTAALVNTSAG